MDFVSIDFETASEKRNSACAIGITVVKNNEIYEEKYWLIKPHEMRFAPMNVWIHGITEEDVENELRMDELWQELKPYLQNNFIIAHNASFDMSVLRNTLDVYGISYPELTYSCSMIIAKNHYLDIENYKLNTVAKYLGIEFKHHHAGEDAMAAAKILIKICEELNINTVEELSSRLGLKIGKLYRDGYSPAGSFKTNTRRPKIKSEFISCNSGDICNVKPDPEVLREDSIFLNKTVVFTGPLGSMARKEAMQKVITAGGKVGSSVTRKTDYLVTGIRNLNKLSYDKKSNKLKKAELLIEKGQDIVIIHENEFLELVR